MTGCRIGKVTYKSVHPLKLISTGVTNWVPLDYANKQAREGNIRMVAVALIEKDGRVHTDFSFRDGTKWASITGAGAALQDFIMRSWNA